MATHSLEIPWTKEPGGLQSRASQRVRHDWATEHAAHIYCICATYIVLYISYTSIKKEKKFVQQEFDFQLAIIAPRINLIGYNTTIM